MVQKRRRGKELEDDILASTLKLISTTKYENLTMDMIAKNARTNKSVLYRRWESKADIVLAALRTRMTHFDFDVPDTGNVRGDLAELFDTIVDTLNQMNYQNLVGLIKERLGGISIADYFDRFSHGNYLTQIVRQILQQADDRGELDLSKVPTQLLDLPVLLMIDTLFLPNVQVTKEQFHTLIDSAMMPAYEMFMN